MLHLRLKAPFGAFRTFTAGSFRPTAPFITPSAAYGLVLNIAGIESRLDDSQAPMTLTRLGLPRVEIALGAVIFPVVQTIYQQLHNYPVGSTGRDRAQQTKGTKYNIQPVQREFLSGLDAYLSIRGNESLEAQVRQGLHGGAHSLADDQPRYGIPFFGDNNFMIDFLREESTPQPAYWYRRLTREIDTVRGRCRLTAWVDRADMTRTVAYLYAPTEDAVSAIPENSWTAIEAPSDIIPPRKGERKHK